MKFTIEYKRTVRVRQYETLTIGWMEEYDSNVIEHSVAFGLVKNLVNYLIDMELGELTQKEGR